MEKEKIINDTYYDLAGFSSVKDHFASAKKKDNDITIDDVRKWRSKNLEVKTNLKGYNSWVPSKPKQEYQADLAFFDMGDPDYIGALFMIDPFTKYASGYPFKTKQPSEILICFKKCIDSMGGKPETIYSDNDGTIASKEIQNYFKDNNIRWLYTNTHAAYVERLIRTLKQYIYKRAEHFNEPWHKYLWSSLLVYNNKSVHSVIGMTPNDATKKHNEFNVSVKLLLNKKYNRQYPSLSVNDTVKVYRKKDLKHKKERYTVWSVNRYEIEAIKEDKHGQKFYRLKGLPKEYMRHELLKN